MEASIHRFVRLLRIRQVRISTSEVLDAMRCARRARRARRPRDAQGRAARLAGQGHPRRGRRSTRSSTRSSPWCGSARRTAGTATGTATRTSPTTGPWRTSRSPRSPSETPQQGHDHGKPVDIKEFFDPEDMAQQYNLHQEANKIDLAAMTDEIVFSKDGATDQTGTGEKVQIETDRLHGGGLPGDIATDVGHEGRRRPQRRPAGGAARVAAGRRGRDPRRGRRDRRDGAAPAPRRDAREPPGGHQAPPRAAAGDRAAGRGRRARRRGRAAGRGRPGRGARAPAARGLPAPAGQDAARRADPQAPRVGPRAHRPGPHDAAQHALRRHPVPAGDGRAHRGQAAPGDPRGRVAVGAGDRAVHAAPRPRAAGHVRAGALVRVRRPTSSRSPTCSPTTPSRTPWG